MASQCHSRSNPCYHHKSSTQHLTRGGTLGDKATNDGVSHVFHLCFESGASRKEKSETIKELNLINYTFNWGSH